MKAHTRLSYIAKSGGGGRGKEKTKTKAKCQGETERQNAKVKEERDRSTVGTFHLSEPSGSQGVLFTRPRHSLQACYSSAKKGGLRIQLQGKTGACSRLWVQDRKRKE